MEGTTGRLVVARGWSEQVDPRHAAFLQRLRDAGVDVLDLHLPAESSPTFEHWVIRYADAIDAAVPDRSEPLRCLGYCVGGSLLNEVGGRLTARGRRFAYLGTVDARQETTRHRLEHNMNARAQVPRRARLYVFLMSSGSPVLEPLHRTLKAWAVARVRTLGSLVTKGPRFLRTRHDPAWHTVRLSYGAVLRGSSVPVHRYVARDSVTKYGDLSLNTAAWSRGGYALRIVGGDHFSCLTDPHLDGLVHAIVDDLRDPLPLLIEVDRGQSRSTPRSEQ